MLKITVGEDCGNAPKKELLRDFNIAFVKGDVDPLLHNITDDICWTMVGDRLFEGKEQVTKMMEEARKTNPTELTINNIITHGNTGAVDGVIKLENGTTYAYCDIYRFGSAKNVKIKEISSYIIKI
jgi:hypothetical protein